MSQRLIWERDGRDWPNREASRFVAVDGLLWHVQQSGAGPLLLLVHGTGASTHSWRRLLPLLAQRFTVIAPDLPGHGFTDLPAMAQLSLPGMASALASLLRALDVAPALVAGHSAGAAILARMTLDACIAPHALMSLNGALLPPRNPLWQMLSPVSKLLARSELMPRMFARLAGDPGAVERLLRDTGSVIDAKGIELYRRLASNPQHVAGALGMMANWDLRRLQRDLPGLALPVTLIVGANDRAILPSEAKRVAALLPAGTVVTFAGLGHLAHEERPDEIAALMSEHAK